MDILWSVLKMGGALFVVLGGIATTAYLAKRFVYPKLGFTSSPIKILATSYLGQKRQISVIEVGGVYLVVGMTPHHISLLTQLDQFPMGAPLINAGGGT